MATYEIKNLEQTLASSLRGSHIVSTRFSKLTSAGDNYVGLLLAVDVTTSDAKNQEQLPLVAKLLPQNEFLQGFFNMQHTFRNEVGFYQTITPCLRDFQKERGLNEVFNSTPDFYGARFSLDASSTRVDSDALLLIKNLKAEGFTIIDRKVGFDLDQSRLVLDKIAEIHATSFALKTLKPEIFDEEIGPFVQKFTIFEEFSSHEKAFCDSILNLLVNDEVSVKNWAKIENAIKKGVVANCKRNQGGDNRFTGLVHSDLWTNNIMVKFENGKMVDVKFVDFQLYEYSSFGRDVIFFLFTSVQIQVLKQHCDNLIALYYDSFINFLGKLSFDTSSFSFEGFLSEFNSLCQEVEFCHVLVMLRAIYASDENAVEVEEVTPSDFFIWQDSKVCSARACFIVHEFISRGWI